MVQRRLAMSEAPSCNLNVLRLTCSLCVLSADLALPVLSIEVLEVPGQGLAPVKLCGEIDWGDVRMVLVLLNLLLHGRVDEV